MKNFQFVIMLVLSTVLATTATAFQTAETKDKLSVAGIFGDGMVLQQQASAAIWGTTNANAKVTVAPSWGDDVYEVQADKDGKWHTAIDTPNAGGPFTIVVSSGSARKEFKDVLSGEVWICSGQSNMQWKLRGFGVDHFKEDVEKANHPSIRFCELPQTLALTPQDDIRTKWQKCTPQSALRFSCVAYFFGDKLREELNVPIGLISTNWGGSSIEAWMNSKDLKNDFPEFNETLNKYPALAEQHGAVHANNKKKPRGLNQKLPSVLYNQMLRPIIPYSARGVIWYQGEANVERPLQYRKLFPSLITNWRKEWGQGDFPFYFVQIAPFQYKKEPLPAALLREAQFQTLAVANTGMAVTMDIGNPNNIHPKQKKPVGERLAMLALANDYGKTNLVCSGPEFVAHKIEADKVRLEFKHVGGGLTTRDGDAPSHLTIAGEDKVFHAAEAKIDNDTILVSSKEVSQPVAVRYAWGNADQPNVMNKEGLPSSSFRTDQWEIKPRPIKAPVPRKSAAKSNKPKPNAPNQTPINVFGYTLLPKENAPETFNAGYSMYQTIWPLLETHPGKDYQSGVFGTWMRLAPGDLKDEKIGGEKRGGIGYNTVEGGSGVWRHNRFPTVTPKFQMGGVAGSFAGIANGPGFGKGRDWNVDKGRYGVAQLSNRVIFPLDGLNYKQGTLGQAFGYGYLPLPLTTPKDKTAGKDVPTGNHCWTLFVNTKTFKGPLTFFTPYFWSRHTLEYPHLHGKYFDSQPNKVSRHIQMETQHLAAIEATANNGDTYARTTRIQFPLHDDGLTHVLTKNTCYNKSALWDAVDAWFKGGPIASGKINTAGSFTTKILDGNRNTWRFMQKQGEQKIRIPIDWKAFVGRASVDDETMTFRFDPELTDHNPEKGLVTLPEYFKLVTLKGGKPKWIPVASKDVPGETGLQKLVPDDFHTGLNKSDPWTTPDDANSVWKTPGPAAGPFKAKLGDGSTLTYHWYKFCDQPSIMMADMSDHERAAIQKRIELLHTHWKPDQEYLPELEGRELVEFDPGLLVTPPSGMEVGFVPIATRQEKE